jgi:hypothetical protein
LKLFVDLSDKALYICISLNDNETKTTIMTTQQKNTIQRMVSQIEKANGKQTVSVLDIRKGHVTLTIFNVRDKVDFIRTTTYCNVEINTQGKITKGFADSLRPQETVIYPYMY